jgi:hypothetical protein
MGTHTLIASGTENGVRPHLLPLYLQALIVCIYLTARRQ